MAGKSQPTGFTYHSVELYKSESLGSGSYGGVCRAKCDGLLCAAKIMHPTLFDRHDPGTATYLSKFLEECQLLSLARHPNVVQYLGTYVDPDTRLPVLLMELCEESLTAFLERSPGQLSYHVQVDICHDIALALVYLHSNGLIHRDLTGNNVLMIAGPRAKITDFGMSKLSNVNPRMTALTLCPGNVLYMSPEALDEAKSYTAKLDVFSFGVVIIQLLTRKFPNPIDRFRLIENDEREIREVVPETERRAAHLRLIPDTHTLKPLVLQCLKKKEVQRPSALELSERFFELKQSSLYRESKRETERETSSDVQQLELQLQGQRMLTKAKTREAEEHLARLEELERIVGDKAKDLEHRAVLEAREQEMLVVISQRNQALERKARELQASEQLVSEFQHSLQQKEKTITDLQQTISVQETKIQQLEQQVIASGDTTQMQGVTSPQITTTPAKTDISKMEWREGENAPEPMSRGTVVVNGNTAYFRPGSSVKVYAYQKYEEQWTMYPDNPNMNFGLVIIDGELTSVGGLTGGQVGVPTNDLLSLRIDSGLRRWYKILPPMLTQRSSASCVTYKESLIVAGGLNGGVNLNVVEVMNTDSKQWATVSPLPQVCYSFSAVVLRDTLYLAGGFVNDRLSKLVFTCSLPEVLASTTYLLLTRHQNVWQESCNLPVTRSTLVTFGDDLLAIGGRDYSNTPTSAVYKYNFSTGLWTVASQMMKRRSRCLAASFSDYLIVVGGYMNSYRYNSNSSVEIISD